MDADEVRRWVESRRRAEELDRWSADPAAPPHQSWQQALSLLALMGRLVGWPVSPDDVRRREDAAAVEAWRRLRAGHGRQA